MRFCGMCGERLPDRSNRGAKTAPSDPDVVPPTTRVFSQKKEEAHRGHGEKWVEAPAGPGNPSYSSIPSASTSSSAGNPRDLVDSLAQRPARREYQRERER